jgi:hypothetical protein
MFSASFSITEKKKSLRYGPTGRRGIFFLLLIAVFPFYSHLCFLEVALGAAGHYSWMGSPFVARLGSGARRKVKIPTMYVHGQWLERHQTAYSHLCDGIAEGRMFQQASARDH